MQADCEIWKSSEHIRSSGTLRLTLSVTCPWPQSLRKLKNCWTSGRPNRKCHVPKKLAAKSQLLKSLHVQWPWIALTCKCTPPLAKLSKHRLFTKNRLLRYITLRERKSNGPTTLVRLATVRKLPKYSQTADISSMITGLRLAKAYSVEIRSNKNNYDKPRPPNNVTLTRQWWQLQLLLKMRNQSLTPPQATAIWWSWSSACSRIKSAGRNKIARWRGRTFKSLTLSKTIQTLLPISVQWPSSIDHRRKAPSMWGETRA